MTWLLVLILAFAPAPHLDARWDGPGRATISWQSPARACLSVTHATGQGVFIGCWPGGARVTLGHVGPLDGAFRPAAGDVYCVSGVGCAPLQGVTYLPVWR